VLSDPDTIAGKKRVKRVVYSASTWMKTFLPGTPQHQLLFLSNGVIDDVDYVPERES
jgi:hypothetical protein